MSRIIPFKLENKASWNKEDVRNGIAISVGHTIPLYIDRQDAVRFVDSDLLIIKGFMKNKMNEYQSFTKDVTQEAKEDLKEDLKPWYEQFYNWVKTI